MSLTDVTLCGKTLCSPVIAASGTFGFGGEYAGIVDMKKLGGISGKGLTLEGKYGNEGERLWETPAGLINSIGLQNPGVRHFIEYELPGMKSLAPRCWRIWAAAPSRLTRRARGCWMKRMWTSSN